MASIHDVARQAGVSVATVSHALNGTRRVEPATRERVVAAAADLRYRPNATARALRTRRTLVLGHLLTHLPENPFHARVAHAVERRAAEAGYAVLIAAGEGPALARARMRTLIERGVDGVIVTTGADAEALLAARQAGLPVVAVERSAEHDGVGLVEVDQAAGSRAIAEALLDLGHRAIGVLGYRAVAGPWAEPDRQRLAGVVAALAARGLTPGPVHLIDRASPRRAADEREAAMALLAGPHRPTAVVANSDHLALLTLQAAYDRRLRAPDDLSVTGWDDTAGHLGAPPLTCVAMPFAAMGDAAVDLLTGLIAGERRPEQARALLSTSLTWRRSAAPPAGAALPRPLTGAAAGR